MKGSIPEMSGWPNSEPEKDQSFEEFTFAVSIEDERRLRMLDFAVEFPDGDKFEEMLQANLQVWQNKAEASQLDGGFWLNKPA
ncbi:MAG: hypothetical protein AAB914_02360 [Patescibacteria group bacterium]